eukprot:14519909-Alexandrium_andersonii.AAC.1
MDSLSGGLRRAFNLMLQFHLHGAPIPPGGVGPDQAQPEHCAEGLATDAGAQVALGGPHALSE